MTAFQYLLGGIHRILHATHDIRKSLTIISLLISKSHFNYIFSFKRITYSLPDLCKYKSPFTLFICLTDVLFAFFGGGENLVVTPEDVDDGPDALTLAYLFYDGTVFLGQKFAKQFTNGVKVEVCTAIHEVLRLDQLFQVYGVQIVRYLIRQKTGIQ